MSTGYRPPSREPKGRWARHIHARRRAEGWSQTRGFEAVQKAGLGLGEKSRSAYIAIDMGDRQPTAAEERALLAVYGPPPEGEQSEAEELTLANALQALATELKAMRQERESVEARLRALESELQSLRAPQGGGASGGQYAPPVEAGSGR